MAEDIGEDTATREARELAAKEGITTAAARAKLGQEPPKEMLAETPTPGFKKAEQPEPVETPTE